jgi:hypothetical protein
VKEELSSYAKRIALLSALPVSDQISCETAHIDIEEL